MPPNLRAGVCVGAAIFHGGRMLLVRRVDDPERRWELPGGSVEEGEALEEGLLREVGEETGLSVVVGPPFAATTFEADAQSGGRVTVVAVEYLCETTSPGPVRLSPEEHDGFVWVRARELAGYRLIPAFLKVVPAAFRAHARRRTVRSPRRSRSHR